MSSIQLNDTENQKYLDQLFELLRIPSISALPEHKQDMITAIAWLKSYLANSGFDAKLMQELYAEGMSADTNHPVLYAERIDDPKNPTVLIYGHYDVQPVDPLDQWISPPFEPTIRDGNIYARGATDDKGQLFTHLAALNNLTQEWGDEWPINVKLVIEGEEEMGGPNLDALLHQSNIQQLFKADYAVISDSGFVAPDLPTIEYGLRGITYMQIDIKVAEADMHSGLFGGGVRSPGLVLAYILNKLYDHETGKVLIPHFYDDVIAIDDQERANLAKVPFDDAKFLQDAHEAIATFGEQGYSTMERTTARPSLDVNGIWGGFSGVGAKTIIPADAHAKVSMRLVANQNPDKIAQLFREYVMSLAPAEVEIKVTDLHHGEGILVDINSPVVKKAAQALQATFGKEPIYSRSGGSIPVVALFKQKLGIDTVLLGYSFPDDNLHSPNEKFNLAQFYKAMECNLRLYQSLGEPT